MLKFKNCEFCEKKFKIMRKKSPNRFCSPHCNRKVLRKNQLIAYREKIKNETSQEKVEALKKHYLKFVVQNKNDCWQWSGAKSCGYGSFGHRGKQMKAHRVSWTIYKGNIPEGLFVLHKCDVRECSNPDHLFLGNNRDNMRDMASKFRTGVRCKLTLEQVYEIKKMLALGVTSMKLAKKYNVSDVAIHNIKHRITWKRAA